MEVQSRELYLSVRDLELSENVLGHVVLCDWVHHVVQVALRVLRGPVLVALLLQDDKFGYSLGRSKNYSLESTET